MPSGLYRTTERVCVGLYALLAAGSVLTYAWVSRPRPPSTPGEPVPTAGVAFVVIGLFWLCVVVSAAMAAVLVLVNLRRRRRGYGVDPLTLGGALVVLCCLAAGAVAGFVVTDTALAMSFAVVALVVAPAGLLVATFGSSVRARLHDQR